MRDDRAEPGHGEHHEPQHHDRTEEAAHLSGAEALDGEETDQDHGRDRDDEVGDAGRSHPQTFNGREHTDRGRDDGVAVEQGDPDDADHEQDARTPRLLRVQTLRERGQRHHPALAVVVGAHQDAQVLDGHDGRDAPEHQRDHAEHIRLVGSHCTAVEQEDRLQCVERARADVAEDDAEGGQRGNGGGSRTAARHGGSDRLVFHLLHRPTLVRHIIYE